MAICLPPKLPTTAPESELKVFKKLQLLSNDWVVLHSVKWQSKRNGRQGDGEADFVLLHPRSGLLILEIKGGGVFIQGGQWYTIDREGARWEIKDPFVQVVASKHALLSYLRDELMPVQDIPLKHAVAFPDIELKGGLGPAAPAEIVWDKEALTSPSATIARTIKHWGVCCHLSNPMIRRITDLLAPTVAIRRRLGDDVSDVREILVELTEQQIWLFSQLRSTRRAVVFCGAGTVNPEIICESGRVADN
jgi:hypothetical protein